MNVCILITGNMRGGGVKVPVQLASYLAPRHSVTILCPIVKSYMHSCILSGASWWYRLTYTLGHLMRHRSDFVFKDEIDPQVTFRYYFRRLRKRHLENFDVVIYLSCWQYYEIKDVPLPKTKCVFWSIADYFFCSAGSDALPAIVEAYRSSHILVAPSAVAKRDFERYGFSPQAVVHGGYDATFHGAGRTWRRERPTILGYYQPYWWVKGAATLLQCLRWVRVRYPHIRIELFGHQASGIGKIGGACCDAFYSGLTNAQIMELYRRHDIFVFPSYSDGFQAPPLEAMACGCAVVATNVGGVPEYAMHEYNALTCQPLCYEGLFSQVERLILDPDLRTRIQANAMRDAPRWTMKRSAQQFEALLEQWVAPGQATTRNIA